MRRDRGDSKVCGGVVDIDRTPVVTHLERDFEAHCIQHGFNLADLACEEALYFSRRGGPAHKKQI